MFRKRILFAAPVVVAALAFSAGSAGACGGLIAPNGAVRLVKTTTLAAHHNGVEHYITNFQFGGTPQSFGSIIPLPGRPTTVTKAGNWTLQRLEREFSLQTPATTAAAGRVATALADVEVVLQTRIDSLDITVVKGGGKEVAEWAKARNFELSPDTANVLQAYSIHSPYFLAAQFDAPAAKAQGFRGGDGIPIHVEIPLENPWVPLRILSLGKPASEIVEARVFTLTDREPNIRAGRGVTLVSSKPAPARLLDDLRSDERMEWIPKESWLSYLEISAPAGDLNFDLDVSVTGAKRVSPVPTNQLALGGGFAPEPANGSLAGPVFITLGVLLAMGVGAAVAVGRRIER